MITSEISYRDPPEGNPPYLAAYEGIFKFRPTFLVNFSSLNHLLLIWELKRQMPTMNAQVISRSLSDTAFDLHRRIIDLIPLLTHAGRWIIPLRRIPSGWIIVDLLPDLCTSSHNLCTENSFSESF